MTALNNWAVKNRLNKLLYKYKLHSFSLPCFCSLPFTTPSLEGAMLSYRV